MHGLSVLEEEEEDEEEDPKAGNLQLEGRQKSSRSHSCNTAAVLNLNRDGQWKRHSSSLEQCHP